MWPSKQLDSIHYRFVRFRNLKTYYRMYIGYLDGHFVLSEAFSDGRTKIDFFRTRTMFATFNVQALKTKFTNNFLEKNRYWANIPDRLDYIIFVGGFILHIYCTFLAYSVYETRSKKSPFYRKKWVEPIFGQFWKISVQKNFYVHFHKMFVHNCTIL